MISWSVTLAEFADMLNHPSKCAVQSKSSYHADPCGFVTSPTPQQSTSGCVFFDTVRLAFFDATLRENRATPLIVLLRARGRACLTPANRATRTGRSRSTMWCLPSSSGSHQGAILESRLCFRLQSRGLSFALLIERWYRSRDRKRAEVIRRHRAASCR